MRTLDQLGGILRHMYESAPSGEKVASIHLFGVKYAGEIQQAGFNARQVVKSAGINSSYLAEVQKGMNLAKYVTPLPRYAD